jgi:hypothetical protein
LVQVKGARNSADSGRSLVELLDIAMEHVAVDNILDNLEAKAQEKQRVR